jgi:hypothetical protein
VSCCRTHVMHANPTSHSFAYALPITLSVPSVCIIREYRSRCLSSHHRMTPVLA